LDTIFLCFYYYCDSRNIVNHLVENKIKREQLVIIGAPCKGMVDKKAVAQGKISRIADFVDAETQSILVYVDVPNISGQKLFGGMYMNARFYGFSLNHVMKVPRSAVFNFDEIFLVVDGKLKKTRIDVVKVDQDYLYFSGPDENSIMAIELPLNPSDQMQVQEQMLKP